VVTDGPSEAEYKNTLALSDIQVVVKFGTSTLGPPKKLKNLNARELPLATPGTPS
jgi:hypothetical protein